MKLKLKYITKNSACHLCIIAWLLKKITFWENYSACNLMEATTCKWGIKSLAIQSGRFIVKIRYLYIKMETNNWPYKDVEILCWHVNWGDIPCSPKFIPKIIILCSLETNNHVPLFSQTGQDDQCERSQRLLFKQLYNTMAWANREFEMDRVAVSLHWPLKAIYSLQWTPAGFSTASWRGRDSSTKVLWNVNIKHRHSWTQ